MGRKGEDLVCNYLTYHRLKILQRNFRTPFGEIDLLASKDGVLFIVEIKTRNIDRREVALISPEQSRRLTRAANWIWVKNRFRYRSVRTTLAVVTNRGINWVSLPLLYDRA